MSFLRKEKLDWLIYIAKLEHLRPRPITDIVTKLRTLVLFIVSRLVSAFGPLF